MHCFGNILHIKLNVTEINHTIVRMTGTFSTTVVILQFIFITSAFLYVNAATGLTITNPATKGRCNGVTVKDVLTPCLAMTNQITISSEITTRDITTPTSLVLRKLVVRLFKGILLASDFSLNATTFGKFCQSISKIVICMNNTVTTCRNNEFAANINKSVVRSEIKRVLHQLPFTNKGSKPTCNPDTGVVSNSFKNQLKQISIKECIDQIPKTVKTGMVEVIESIGNATIDQNVQLTDRGKSASMARSVCRKLNDTSLLFKQAASCNSKKCNGKAVSGFSRLIMHLLATPGVRDCGKEIKEDEVNKKKGDKTSKKRSTINIVGLGHIKNPKIGSNFETCVMDSGEVTLITSDSLVIKGTIVKRSNASGHEYSYLTKTTVQMFGDKKNCGKTGDTPVVSISFGKGVNTPHTNIKSKCGKNHIMVKTMTSQQAGSSRIRIIDQCAAVAIILRSVNVTTLDEVLYLTVRISETIELAGTLFSGCTKQVSVRGISDNVSRRKKRDATSQLTYLGGYDYDVTKDKALETAALATGLDEDDAVEADEDALDGSGSTLAAATLTSVFVAVATLVLSR